jgi:hypothetical protein
MCCGDIIHNPRDIVSYEDIQSDTLCWDCRDNRTCEGCGKIEYDLPIKSPYGDFCSKECVQSQWFIPGQNSIISKADFLDTLGDKFLIFYAADQEEMRKLKNDILENPIKPIEQMSHGEIKKFVKEQYNKDIDIFNHNIISRGLIPIWRYLPHPLIAEKEMEILNIRMSDHLVNRYRYVLVTGERAEDFKERAEQIKNRVSLETIV